MPKITCVFNCNAQKLIPLISSENIEAIKGKYDVGYCEKKMFSSPPNTFHFGKTNKPLDSKYTMMSKSFDINDDFFNKLKSISEIFG